MRTYTIPSGLDGYFLYVYEETDPVLFGGSGTEALTTYCNTTAHNEPGDMDDREAIVFAKNAIEYASQHDLTTGGDICVYSIDRFECKTCIWIPIDENNSAGGYRWPVDDGGNLVVV